MKTASSGIIGRNMEPPRRQKDALADARPKRQPSDLQLVTRQTLADSVYVQLRTAITRGRLRDGTELKQAELAARLGVSRVPVREALRRLQAEHLVVANPFQRFVVTSLTHDQVMELVDLREELEVFALKRAISSGSALQGRAKEAKAAAKGLAVNQDAETWLEADREFHRALNGRTTAVAAIIEDVRERVHRYLHSAVASAERRHEVLAEHAALLAALEKQDERAIEKAIRQHVRGTRDVLRQSFVDVGPDDIEGGALLSSELAEPF